MTPYTIYPGQAIVTSPRYFGSIDYYATVAAYEHSVVDYGTRYDKRYKYTHRTVIADVNGPLLLTVPLSHPSGERHTPHLTWREMKISPHGDWWNVHRVALESAYGRTPFFEFYIDRFLPVLKPQVINDFPTLEDVDAYIDRNIRELLGLPIPLEGELKENNMIVTDMRRHEPQFTINTPPYYQVRASKLGFINGLSVLDLLFNMGPESCLWLRNYIKSVFTFHSKKLFEHNLT